MIWTVTVLSLLVFLDEVIARLVTVWGAVQKSTVTINSQCKLPDSLTIFICLIHSAGQLATTNTCECTDSYVVVSIGSQLSDNKTYVLFS